MTKESINWLEYLGNAFTPAADNPGDPGSELQKHIKELIDFSKADVDDPAASAMTADANTHFVWIKNYFENNLQKLSAGFGACSTTQADTDLYDNFVQEHTADAANEHINISSIPVWLTQLPMLHFVSILKTLDADSENVYSAYNSVLGGANSEDFKLLLPDELKQNSELLYIAAKKDISCLSLAREAAIKLLKVSAAAGPESESESKSMDSFRNTVTHLGIPLLTEDERLAKGNIISRLQETRNEQILAELFNYRFPEVSCQPLLTNPSLSIRKKYEIITRSHLEAGTEALYQELADSLLLVSIYELKKILEYPAHKLGQADYIRRLAFGCRNLENSVTQNMFTQEEFQDYQKLSGIILTITDSIADLEKLLATPFAQEIDLFSVTPTQIIDASGTDIINSEFWMSLETAQNHLSRVTDELFEEGKAVQDRLRQSRTIRTLFAKPELPQDKLPLLTRALKQTNKISKECAVYIAEEIGRTENIMAAGCTPEELDYITALGVPGLFILQEFSPDEIETSGIKAEKLSELSEVLRSLKGHISAALVRGDAVISSPDTSLRQNKSASMTGMNIMEYYNEFYRLAGDMNKTGSSREDETEYILFHSDMERILKKIRTADDTVFFDILYEGLQQLNTGAEKYKEVMAELPKFTSVQFERIKTMNRFQHLLYELEDRFAKPETGDDAVNSKLVEKIFHYCLMKGLSGPKGELYKRHLLNAEEIYAAGKEMLVVRPFVQAYNKPISMKDRAKMLRLPSEQITAAVCKALKRTPEQILAYSDIYNDITK